jgi:putative ABC transport system permease protein
MYEIAIKTLIADRGKLITALVGVIFSVVLVNIQGGLFLGLVRKASLLVDYGEADIWVGHRNMHAVDFPRDIPTRWVYRLRGIPGVRRAEPYLIGFSEMTLPSGGYESLVVVGVDRESLLGNAWNLIEGRPESILQTDGVVVDVGDDAKLEYPHVGELREIGGRRVRIVGKSHGILGFLVTPYVFTTFEQAAVFSRKDPEVCSYFLVQIAPDADVDAVCQAIQARLPDADVYPRNQYSRVSINYWMTRTGLGISFGAATTLGLLIGLVMVAQALYALVLDRIGDFGTLKAIGADEQQVYRLLLVQAVVLAFAGAVLGLLLVAIMHWGFHSDKAPILIPLWLSLGSCLLVTVICIASSILPYLRLRRVDPLVILQG